MKALFCTLLILVVAACQKDKYLPVQQEDTLRFRKNCGYCQPEDLSPFYEVSSTQLLAFYPDTEAVNFQQRVLETSKFISAKRLLDSLPLDLLSEEANNIPCVGCLDAPSLSLIYESNRGTQQWELPIDSNDVPPSLVSYFDIIAAVLSDLEEQ